MATANNNSYEPDENKELFREKYEFLVAVLPDAHPIYLRDVCKEYEDEYEFQRFIRKSLRKKQYPRKIDYDRELEVSKQKQFYKSNFKVEEFIKIIPNPEEYFSDKNSKRMRKIENMRSEEIEYATTYLKNYFPYLPAKQITTLFNENSYGLIKTIESLKKCDVKLKKKRYELPIFGEEDISVDLLQEIAYIKRRDEILLYLKNKKQEKQDAIEVARILKLLNTCDCCFDDEVIPAEIISCEDGHNFCLTCTRTGCEIALEHGQKEFRCFAICDYYFDIHDLEKVLPPTVYSNIYKSKQLKEVKSAALENLECCPHCDFAAVIPPENKVFHCMNPECLKETCRQCRQPSHIPLRCAEVEVCEDVKRRTYIEDKMTEALVRTCYNCNMKFLKEDGCNKITCPCGAIMCYICKEPVKDYKHFNGDGGDKYHLCPLFSNTKKLHATNVLEEALKLRDTGENKLKIDPTKDIEVYYKTKDKNKKKKRRSCDCKHCAY